MVTGLRKVKFKNKIKLKKKKNKVYGCIYKKKKKKELK